MEQPKKFYVVDGRDLADVRIAIFPDDDSAAAAMPAEGLAHIISEERDLLAFGPKALVAIYNRVRGSLRAVRRFESKEVGVARTWVLIESFDPTAPAPAPEAELAPVETQLTTEEEADMANSKLKRKRARAPKKTSARERSTETVRTKSTTPRGEKTKEIARLLQRKNGVTRAEILEATGWPSISVQAIAKSLGFKLTKTKEKGKPTSYFGEPKG